MKVKFIVIHIIWLFVALSALADTPADSVKVVFDMGKTQIDPELGNNGERMADFISRVKAAGQAGTVDRITVSAKASPDGPVNLNRQISQQRCDAIVDYIMKRTGLGHSSFETIAGGEAWDELRALVVATPDVPMREQVLEIIDHTPLWIYDSQSNITGGRKQSLMNLGGGLPYRWMSTHLFPKLRNAVAIALYVSPVLSGKPEVCEPDNSGVSQPEDIPAADTAFISGVQLPAEESYENNAASESLASTSDTATETSEVSGLIAATQNGPRFAIKTNMLYDAALVPNLGAEFYLGKNISLYGEWMYAWWDSNRRHRYWRIYGGDLGLRWWFGRKAREERLSGHHLGVYCGILTFDFEWGNTGYMGGKPGGTLWDRFLVNTGIEYGYSLPVARHLNIDFSIGLGYLGGHYIEYFPFDNDYFNKKEYRMRYFGPTKAEISLVWLIGGNSSRSKKGGDR